MSTETMERSDIPDTFEVRGGNLRFYGIADGRIKTRASKNDPWECLDKIHGIFDRVGEHQGEWNGKPMPKFEIDLLLKDGTKASISTNADSAVATVMLASRILKVCKGQVIGISVARSKEPCDNGSHLTFVNVSIWDPMGSKWIEIVPDDPFKGKDSSKRLAEVLVASRKHPDYAPRPTRKAEFDYDTAELWECFAHEAGQKGWPAFMPNQAAYMEWAGHKGVEPGKAPDDLWTGLRKKLSDGASPPKKLVDLIAASPATAEYDPFADE